MEKEEIKQTVLEILERERELADQEREEKRKNNRFVMVFDDALTSALQLVAGRSGQAIQLWMFLGAHMDRKGGVVVSYEVIAGALGIDARNVPRLLKILKEHGVVWTMKGYNNVYCMNPDVTWRAGADGKQYALFNAAILADREEYLMARERARKLCVEAQKVVEDRMKSVRGLIVNPTFQQHFEPPIGPEPPTEISMEPAGKEAPKKGPGLRIKRPTKRDT